MSIRFPVTCVSKSWPECREDATTKLGRRNYCTHHGATARDRIRTAAALLLDHGLSVQAAAGPGLAGEPDTEAS